MTNTITLTLDQNTAQSLMSDFRAFSVQPPQYAVFQCRTEGCTITLYQSGKAVFQGKNAEICAASYTIPVSVELPQAGSDEVGTGDYFGPVCVAAVCLDSRTYKRTAELGVRDSKQLGDDDIRRIAPELIRHLPHSLLIVSPEKYNNIHRQYNMNAIKSLLHNQAYNNLQNKTALPSLIVIDQFTPESSYYRYLKGRGDIITGIRFETKAEDKYPAVGAASIIARYAFLCEMDRMSTEWNMEFRKGAGTDVDACAREFAEHYGKDQLYRVAKLHFKNTERI